MRRTWGCSTFRVMLNRRDSLLVFANAHQCQILTGVKALFHFAEATFLDALKKSRDRNRGSPVRPALRLRNQCADLAGVCAFQIAGINRGNNEVVGNSGLDGGFCVRRHRNRRGGQFCVWTTGLRRRVGVVADHRGRTRRPG
jgi:hypothetical protein